METIQQLLQYILHIDSYLISFVSTYGVWTYIVLFLIIFCETGLVVTPFLPGDSLLFAAGSIAANASHALDIQLLFLLLTLASILGNKVNYLIGRMLGPRVFVANQSWLLNKKHLEEAHRFYEKHGGKTLILARYIPIIRTFAPFVAGVGYMSLRTFSFYNIASAILWIGSLLGAGYFFGSLPFIKDNFSLVVYSIIAVSLVPPIFAFVYRKAFSACH
ncbi:DedA family protein [Aquicella lusitana]|uniref:Membrane-associated protein n=1 Tax=Aquicella lusitana TaxID=254246 RepID=A0A370GYA5_9COXI|nr:DedA family protein [Aquicella lusitana]RDI48632.1 membrane-associated protein [Aquicella lusitana]VVC73991.1 putative membrane protein [Aquicella lusitana]